MDQDGIFWNTLWAILGVITVAILLSTRGCYLESKRVAAELHIKAASEGCIFIEGHENIMICQGKAEVVK